MNTTNCPNCNYKLKEVPTRKKKCPTCGKYIFVRSGELLTENQATIKDWIKRLENLGLTEKEYKLHSATLAKQFGQTPLINDVIWRFFNLQLTKSKSYFNSKIIYLEMARLLSKEGKDPNRYLAEAAKMELLELKKSWVLKVTIYTCNDNFVCSVCRKLENQVFTIANALEKMPIPYTCQNKDGCRCTWGSVSLLGK